MTTCAFISSFLGLLMAPLARWVKPTSVVGLDPAFGVCGDITAVARLNPDWLDAQMIEVVYPNTGGTGNVCKTLLPLFQNFEQTGRRFTAGTITFENGYKMLVADKEIPKYLSVN